MLMRFLGKYTCPYERETHDCFDRPGIIGCIRSLESLKTVVEGSTAFSVRFTSPDSGN